MNNFLPFISIIIPVYNTEKYLHRCIDSVLAQSYSNFELILVDDGSQDNSGQICDDYAKQDGRIIVLHQENQGVSIARNNGLDIAKGDYISFVDSDDMVSKDIYSSNIMFFYQHPNLDIIQYPYASSEDEKKSIDPRLFEGKEEIFSNWFQIGPITPIVCDKLFKRSVIGDAQFLPYRKYWEDKRFLFSILDRINNLFLSDKGCYYYIGRDDSCFFSRNVFEAKYNWLEDEIEILIHGYQYQSISDEIVSRFVFLCKYLATIHKQYPCKNINDAIKKLTSTPIPSRATPCCFKDGFWFYFEKRLGWNMFYFIYSHLITIQDSQS